MPDLELLTFQRTINLAEYARAAAGYQPCARDSTSRLAVLEQPLAADRIAVARAQGGAWVYARLDGYALRAAEEAADRAYARLRECAQRARDRGTIVEFVQSTQRVLGRDEVSLERVREHLRAWEHARRALEAPREQRMAVEDARHAIHRRLGDWVPSRDPVFSEVQDRLRRWREAERVIDLKIARGSDVERSLRLHQARTDWQQHLSAEHARALGLDPRSRGPERGR